MSERPMIIPMTTTARPPPSDLERLADFQAYYNEARSHASLDGHTPLAFAGGHTMARAELNNVRWVSHCRDLVQPWWWMALSGVAGGVLGGLLLGVVTGSVAQRLTPWVGEARSLRGQVSVVTGANSGLGQEIALGLARLGAAVVLLCRRASEGERVRQTCWPRFRMQTSQL